MCRQMRKKRFRFAECVDFKPGRLEQPGNGFPDRSIVINKTNSRENVSHATTLPSRISRTQSDLGPGSQPGSHFRFLQHAHELSYRRYAKLLHHMGAMSLDCFFGHPELATYLFVKQSRSNELHHLVFTWRQSLQ